MFNTEMLKAVEDAAWEWGGKHYPNAPDQHHAAFVNSVIYALFRFSGRYGAPSIREHTASAAINECGVTDWQSKSREELFAFLAPVVYGQIGDLHIKTWIMLSDICFDNDTHDIQELNEAAKHAAKDTRYSSTRIWAQTLRKLGIVSAMRGESIVECIDHLVNAELSRLHYTKE